MFFFVFWLLVVAFFFASFLIVFFSVHRSSSIIVATRCTASSFSFFFFCRVSVSPPQVDSFSIHFLKPSLRISPRDVRPHEANHLLLLLPLRNPQLIHSTSIQVRRRLRRVRWFNRHAISNEKQNQSTTAPTVDALATYERRLFFFLSSFFRWYFDL